VADLGEYVQVRQWRIYGSMYRLDSDGSRGVSTC